MWREWDGRSVWIDMNSHKPRNLEDALLLLYITWWWNSAKKGLRASDSNLLTSNLWWNDNWFLKYKNCDDIRIQDWSSDKWNTLILYKMDGMNMLGEISCQFLVRESHQRLMFVNVFLWGPFMAWRRSFLSSHVRDIQSKQCKTFNDVLLMISRPTWGLEYIAI
jgi:hypothetical protein